MIEKRKKRLNNAVNPNIIGFAAFLYAVNQCVQNDTL